MDRAVLNDGQWGRIAPLLPGKPGDPGRSGKDNRLFLEAVLWLARTGAPWRDLSARFGNWNSVFRRFRRWTAKGVFESLFKHLSDDPDFEYAIVDGTVVRVHQHGASARGDTKSRYRPVLRRFDDEEPGAHRCAGQPGTYHVAAGPAS